LEELVLVVDDNDDDRQIMTAILRHFGYVVLSASDGFAAIGIADNSRPGVAVIDLAMPGLSGIDLALAFRADAELSRMGLVAVSAHPEYRTLAESSGFDTFLRKPCDSSRLVGAVRQLISGDPPNQIAP
jgi:CheY-like chemotaxis protein